MSVSFEKSAQYTRATRDLYLYSHVLRRNLLSLERFLKKAGLLIWKSKGTGDTETGFNMAWLFLLCLEQLFSFSLGRRGYLGLESTQRYLSTWLGADKMLLRQNETFSHADASVTKNLLELHVSIYVTLMYVCIKLFFFLILIALFRLKLGSHFKHRRFLAWKYKLLLGSLLKHEKIPRALTEGKVLVPPISVHQVSPSWIWPPAKSPECSKS